MEEHKMVSDKIRNLVGAVDQGTSSTRFFIFASDTAEVIAYHQIETKQLYPKAGWVEQDPLEILESVTACIEQAVKKLKELEIDPCNIKAIGVTNQRETTVVWNKRTGLPLYNAIIWLDNRTVDIVERLNMKRGSKAVKEKCGLPITTYFSATKLAWLIENVPEVNDAIEKNECLFGTIDSWLIWNLTGGTKRGIHVTDVTNASNTMLLNIRSLEWDPWLCNFFQIPMSILPSVKSSSEILGFISNGAITGVPISGCLGDQSSALVGQTCFLPGSVKNTYGTGCFFLCNTGKVPVWSKHGLLTNVAYKLGPDTPAVYALEGSVAISGAVFRWLRDNLGIISDLSCVETLASTFDSTHGVYFVPAFSGLYAPYWDPNARGILCGLTQFSTKAHIVRAALEAGCFQTCKIVDAMNLDTGLVLEKLKVDGGMTSNTLLMQIQADLLGIPVNLPTMCETTALGIAMVAGAAKGIEVWDLTAAEYSPVISETFIPSISQSERELRCSMWEKAVKRSMNWADESTKRKATKNYLLQSLPGDFFLLISFCILVAAEKLQK